MYEIVLVWEYDIYFAYDDMQLNSFAKV